MLMLLGERLKDIDFAKIITSPSGRTIETTELIVKDRDVLVQKMKGSWKWIWVHGKG